MGNAANPPARADRVIQPASEPSWEAPGPGTWELDTTHFVPMSSRVLRDIMGEVLETGLAQGFELLGSPLKTMQAGFVNGSLYFRLVPLVGGSRDLPSPPKPLLWLLTRLHPEFRRRSKQSERAIEERVWLQEFQRWEREWKPNLTATNLRLGAVDETALGDTELAGHLSDVVEHLRWSGTLHFRLHASDLGPIGRLLIAGEDWGLDQGDLMGALAGSSPATSAPVEALAEIRRELDRCGVNPSTLHDVRAASAKAQELLDQYLAEYGNRLTTGYDVRDVTLGEMPEVVLASIRDRRPDDGPNAEARGEAALARLRSEVATAHLDELDMLVNDARLLYGLRDENGPLTFEWPAGVLRRVVLEIARRFVESGALAETEHIFDATVAEMAALLKNGAGPSATDLEKRCAQRVWWATLTPKAVLGPPSVPPPIDVLPGRMPEMMRAILTVTELLDGDVDAIAAGAKSVAAELVGTGIGAEVYRGVARVVTSADEALDRAEPGDIIVTKLTVPTFNSVLAMAGGVVTENGGLLCHTAVIARELGIPAVVGVAAALTAIPDGANIEIDPVAGRVTVLDAAL